MGSERWYNTMNEKSRPQILMTAGHDLEKRGLLFFMAWVYLIFAGIMEWGWPLGLKLGWTSQGPRFWPLALAIVSMVVSGALLLLAQRVIPMGTAYAVWTGIGAVGTFVLGIVYLGEPADVARFVCVGLIVAGIAGLKLLSA